MLEYYSIRSLNKSADGPKALTCDPEPLGDTVVRLTINITLMTLQAESF